MWPAGLVRVQLGLKKQDMIDVVALGAIASPMFALKGPAMAKASYPPGQWDQGFVAALLPVSPVTSSSSSSAAQTQPP